MDWLVELWAKASGRGSVCNDLRALITVPVMVQTCICHQITASFRCNPSVDIHTDWLTDYGPPLWSPVFRYLSRARKAAGSTSGSSISVEVVAMPPLNMASNTALPAARTNLWAGILWACLPFPTMNLTSLSSSLLKRKAKRSFRELFVACQLYMGSRCRPRTGGEADRAGPEAGCCTLDSTAAAPGWAELDAASWPSWFDAKPLPPLPVAMTAHFSFLLLLQQRTVTDARTHTDRTARCCCIYVVSIAADAIALWCLANVTC